MYEDKGKAKKKYGLAFSATLDIASKGRSLRAVYVSHDTEIW